MADILIKNGLLITMDPDRRIVLNGAVMVTGNRIAAVGDTEKVVKDNPRPEFTIDAGGKAILPGLVNIHTHTPTPHLRIPDYGWRLMGGIRDVYRDIGAEETAEVIYRNSMVSCLELLRFGSTTIKDSYDMADQLARAVADMGLRGVISELISEVDVTRIVDDNWGYDEAGATSKLTETLRFMKEWEGKMNGRITTALSPQAPDMVREPLMKRFHEAAVKHDKLLSIHAAQGEREVTQVKRLYGRTPIEHLSDMGVLGPKTLLAHCIYTSDTDTGLIAESGAKIMHCPVSQTLRGGTLAPVVDWVRRGVPFGLGTDNINHDMFTAMRRMMMISEFNKNSYRYHTSYQSYTITPIRALEIATIEGARLLGMEKEIGSLEPGKKADIITLGLAKPHLYPLVDPVNNIVRYAQGSDVEDVIIDGVIVKDGSGVKTVDEEAVLRMGQETGNRILTRFFELHPELKKPEYLGWFQ